MAITTYSELKTAVANWLSRSTLTSRIPEFITLAEDRIYREIRIRPMESVETLVFKASKSGGTVGGTVDVITLTPTTAATSYALGDVYTFTAAGSNTTTVTVNISGLGAQNVKKYLDGQKAGLAASDIKSGQSVRLYYDGTDFILSPPGSIPLPSNYLAARRLIIDTTDKGVVFYPPSEFWMLSAANDTGRPANYTIEGDFIVTAPVADSTYYAKFLHYRKFAALTNDSDTNWIMSNARGLYLYGALLESAPFLVNDARIMLWTAMYNEAKELVEAADNREKYPDGILQMRVDA